MCISYATTTKNKDANALSTVSLGVSVVSVCVFARLCNNHRARCLCMKISLKLVKVSVKKADTLGNE